MSSKSFIALIILGITCATFVVFVALIALVLSWTNLHLLVKIGVSLIMFGSLVFYGVTVVNGASLIKEAKSWQDE